MKKRIGEFILILGGGSLLIAILFAGVGAALCISALAFGAYDSALANLIIFGGLALAFFVLYCVSMICYMLVTK